MQGIIYQGDTEEERIEAALHVQNIEEIAYYLQRSGLLTGNKAGTLELVRSWFIASEPAQQDQTEQKEVMAAPAEPEPAPEPTQTPAPAPRTQRKGLRPVV
jgi:hypothetical protein